MLRRDSLPPSSNGALETLLPSSFVVPRYGGASIANLPATLGHLLGVRDGWAGPPLEAGLLESLGGGFERVVLLLVDGLGWNRLRQQLEEDGAGFEALLEAHGAAFAPVTSVAPSTTCVATTVLLGDGALPAELGMLGYTLLLPALGLVANLLFWRPAYQPQGVSGSLESWGLKPETFLPTPSLAQALSRGGVLMEAVMPAAYSHSPLSRMQFRGSSVRSYLNSTDLWLQMEGWLRRRQLERGFLYAYYPDFDALGHRDGIDAEFFALLWRDFMGQFTRFLQAAASSQQGKTLVLVTADHGHTVTPFSARRTLQGVPDLLERSLMMPGGEARHLYLYAKDGERQTLLECAKEGLEPDFAILDADEALGAGLYGDPSRAHPETRRRLGNVIVLARGANYLWDARNETVMLGMHGALDPDEMIVPFIALRV